MKTTKPIEINFKPFKIQMKALNYLFDNKTTEVLFGGAARVSKSYLACAFATISCLQTPNVSVAICRSRITYLKKSTMLVLFEFFKDQGLEENVHYTFNRQDNIITFLNGSKILFLELYDNPSDPNFERILSISLLHAIIDEASEISRTAYQTLMTRLTPNTQGIHNKILIVTNPCKGFIYEEFYKPFKNRELDNTKAVILGLPQDNELIGDQYFAQQSKVLTGAVKRRLLYGDWDFADEEYSVYKYDDLINCFYNKLIYNDNVYYLSCDISDGQVDNSVLVLWRGNEIVKIERMKEKTPVVEQAIKQMIRQFNIKMQNVVIDSDGVGVGVSNRLKGCYQFKNSSKPLNKENYANLKTQCIVKLAELVSNQEINFPEDEKETILKEFLEIRYDGFDHDQLRIESKKKLKQRLGYSPDTFDAIFMKMVFLLKPKNNIYITMANCHSK